MSSYPATEPPPEPRREPRPVSSRESGALRVVRGGGGSYETFEVLEDETLSRDPVGSVHVWPNVVAAYVSQPQRPVVVEGTDHFAAVHLRLVDVAAAREELTSSGEMTALRGLVRPQDHLVTAAQRDLATRVLAAFLTDPSCPDWLRAETELHAQQYRHRAARIRQQTTQRIADLTDLLATLDRYDTALEEAIGTPFTPLPEVDLHLRDHPAFRT